MALLQQHVDPGTPLIEVDQVSRSFHGVPVVRSVSLQVHAGEITALVGPNGSGKTTLMLMLATLLRPDTGSIKICGHNATSATGPARASLGWMPDTLGAWGDLTVRETLAAVCAMYGLRGQVATARVDELLERTALAPLSSQRTHTLSRGQKQRLSLARALVHHPRVLLLDEPASGLDPEARLAQRRLLLELAAQGVAILVTSHVLDELEQFATRVVFLRDGHTQDAGAVSAALQHTSEWRIRALDAAPLEAALTAQHVPWRVRSGLTGVNYLVDVVSEAEAVALLRGLVTAGVDVLEFTAASGSLEQAFVQLNDSEAKS
ncbi:ABC-type multidrug transport system ATPase subunit [Leucobacter exalbidus]|uniref:ABC-type multidrug transport system ATPase subunit n=1 Tax=Leucobacter exalbidus TaxID=662960 RepID=A0A940PUB9_9MICO|nr:ABC transporter ATP-binding protein [Leucobacter exalbidus]MBP1327604.1 ABC-type multidrug transport system ATPase subunit [Leucobacter exalbidus]